jgi:hypothetical protein
MGPEKPPVSVCRVAVTIAGSAGDNDTSSGMLRAFPVDDPAAPECPAPGAGVSALTTPRRSTLVPCAACRDRDRFFSCSGERNRDPWRIRIREPGKLRARDEDARALADQLDPANDLFVKMGTAAFQNPTGFGNLVAQADIEKRRGVRRGGLLG